MRLDVWLVVALALAFGGSYGAAPGLALATLAGLTLVLGQGQPLWVGLLVGGAFGLGSVRAEQAVQRFEAERVAVRDALGEPQRCSGTGTILRSPVKLGGTLKSQVRFDGLDCENRRLVGPVHVRLYGGNAHLSRGDRIWVVVQLAPVRIFRRLETRMPVLLAARQGAVLSGSALVVEQVGEGHGLGHAIDRLRAKVRQRIEHSFAPAAVPMARALVLGESDLTPEDDEAFKLSGLSHLLAVSGTHLVFAVVSLVTALRALLVRWEALAVRFDVMRLACTIGMVLALLYADISGGSGSAWRAAWMLALAFLTRAVNRRPRPARVVALTLLCGALLDPLLFSDVSFLLSLAATAGLILIGQRLAAPCLSWRSKLLRYLGVSVAATVSSMIPCAPLLAWLSPEMTLAGVIANVIAAPIGELVALPLCLVHALCAAWPALEQGIALVASGALLAVRAVAHQSAAQEWLAHSVPSPHAWHYAVLALGAALVWQSSGTSGPGPKRAVSRVLLLGAAGLALWALERGAHAALGRSQRLSLTSFDVGQGDGHLLELPGGQTMLIDAGGFMGTTVDPGARAILPALRDRRIAGLDVMVLSHPHPDHFGGLRSVVKKLEIGEFWDTGQGEREGAGPVYRELMQTLRRRGVPILGPSELCGVQRRFSPAVVEVLAPCPGYVSGRDANDNSWVIRVRFKQRALLLTGDSEAEAEAELLQHGSLRADLLKVGHHGSRTSTGSAFLAAVDPRFALISCGVRNRFGHPHPEIVQRLAAAGVELLRTDRAGSLRWVTDGTRVEVYGAASPR